MRVLDFQEREVDLGRDTHDRRVHRPAASADERPHSPASARSCREHDLDSRGIVNHVSVGDDVPTGIDGDARPHDPLPPRG